MIKEEFGTVIKLPEMTLESLQDTLTKLKDDYDHQHKHSFPFYDVAPALLIHKLGDTAQYMDGTPAELAPGFVFGWYLEVPEENVVS